MHFYHFMPDTCKQGKPLLLYILIIADKRTGMEKNGWKMVDNGYCLILFMNADA